MGQQPKFREIKKAVRKTGSLAFLPTIAIFLALTIAIQQLHESERAAAPARARVRRSTLRFMFLLCPELGLALLPLQRGGGRRCRGQFTPSPAALAPPFLSRPAAADRHRVRPASIRQNNAVTNYSTTTRVEIESKVPHSLHGQMRQRFNRKNIRPKIHLI